MEGVKFVLMVNKQGHTRFSKWMQHVEDDPHRRRMMEYELVRKCMPRDVDHVRIHRNLCCSCPPLPLGSPCRICCLCARCVPAWCIRRVLTCCGSALQGSRCRSGVQATFIPYRGFTVVYRRYASLFFMVGIDNSQVRATALFAFLPAAWPRNVRVLEL